MKAKEFLGRLNSWVTVHWRQCLLMLCVVIAMQQCVIGNLSNQVAELKALVEAGQLSGTSVSPLDSLASARSDSSLAQNTAQPSGLLSSESGEKVAEPGSGSLSEDGSKPETAQDDDGVSFLGVLMAIAVVVAIILGFVYMYRNAVYPIGLWVSGRLRAGVDGRLTMLLNVTNRSSKDVEVKEAIVNFAMRGGTRRFKMNMSDLPMLLQGGTSYVSQINLLPIVERNPELRQTYAIYASILVGNKRVVGLPRLVKFK